MPKSNSHSAAWRRIVFLLAGGLFSFAVCTDNENFREFRVTAGPGIETGILAILDGDETAFDIIIDSVVAGLFDIVEPDSSSDN